MMTDWNAVGISRFRENMLQTLAAGDFNEMA